MLAAQKLHSAVVHFHPNVGRDFQIEVLRRFHAMGTFERVTFESMGYRDFDASLEYLQTCDWSEIFPDGACIYHKHMIQ